jgi:uncharacterized membrane protein YeaQ/YmgE (transglycosylase-associated protein family)
MDMSGTLGLIVGTILVGLVAGFLARAIVPGKDAMGILPTILLGIVGSFVGTGVAWLLKLEPGAILTWVLTIGGAVLALLIYNRFVAKKV